jgi:hypothetical protein
MTVVNPSGGDARVTAISFISFRVRVRVSVSVRVRVRE